MYNKIKNGIYNLIRDDDTNNIASNIFDGTIIVLIMVNSLIVILETFDGFTPITYSVFKMIELVSVIIFTIEYVMRLWTSDLLNKNNDPLKSRLKYVFSFMAIIDLLAILPFYLPFFMPIDLRVLRMVRLLRLVRILKVNRYTNALVAVGTVIKKKSVQLLSSMFVVFVLIVIASVLMYNIENEAQPEQFKNAFSGLWWAVATLTTVGYGDIFPITLWGKILSGVIAILGIGLVAVPTGIISAGFIEEIQIDKANEEHDEKCYCPYCGKKIS